MRDLAIGIGRTPHPMGLQPRPLVRVTYCNWTGRLREDVLSARREDHDEHETNEHLLVSVNRFVTDNPSSVLTVVPEFDNEGRLKAYHVYLRPLGLLARLRKRITTWWFREPGI